LCHNADATSADEEGQTPSSSFSLDQDRATTPSAACDSDDSDDDEDTNQGCADQDTVQHQGEWQRNHAFLIDDPTKRRNYLGAHCSFIRRCVDNLRTANMADIGQIILLMLASKTAMSKYVHASQLFTWYLSP
jgi:hypothetical protein